LVAGGLTQGRGDAEMGKQATVSAILSDDKFENLSRKSQ